MLRLPISKLSAEERKKGKVEDWYKLAILYLPSKPPIINGTG
jgi:hypothetical protein